MLWDQAQPWASGCEIITDVDVGANIYTHLYLYLNLYLNLYQYLYLYIYMFIIIQYAFIYIYTLKICIIMVNDIVHMSLPWNLLAHNGHDFPKMKTPSVQGSIAVNSVRKIDPDVWADLCNVGPIGCSFGRNRGAGLVYHLNHLVNIQKTMENHHAING